MKKISKEYTTWSSLLVDMNCKSLEKIMRQQEPKSLNLLSWTKTKRMQRKISTSIFWRYRMTWIKKLVFTLMYRRTFCSRWWSTKTRGIIQWRLTYHLERTTSEELSDSVCLVLSNTIERKMKKQSKSFTHLQWALVWSSWQNQNCSMKVLKNRALMSRINSSILITL